MSCNGAPMKPAYAFPGAMLVCALWLFCFHGASPVLAQGALGQQTTICSKSDKTFRQTGVLKRLDERNYVLLTPAGELVFNKVDFEACTQPAPPPRADRPPACPAGQMWSMD